ncbi:hypothetical protein CHGG_10484 [Chaetomium globosum CBS 148.51]|uniref:Uncharacterized protein n=1 Tax=Chaetomium globosum (strain ATCC 6205 / CBS 148.51 / DSM 1962 / NBRC 6347 / NRRL 1970) TaxID=306901 RepID=Q2GNH0_CHAGB|nr:uncharacterized protein CHGG_10484 [Chaetomium globosum CBS 148.51]EAQ84080.1 hypothetical protein CHGG_10484 [Chaetomium globosum CBS 148.51]
MASPPASTTTGPTPSGSRIGRPPQWTVSRSRKLARLYLYSTLSIEKIIKVLEDDGFNPRKNSAQKTIHKMLDNDPRYLRPESRAEMGKRINSLTTSPTRRKKKGVQDQRLAARRGFREEEAMLPGSEVTSPSGLSVKAEDPPAFDYSTSPDASGLGNFKFPSKAQDTTGADKEAYLVGVQNIKRRVSECSSHFALQLSSLIKDFTISICSDGQSSGRRASAAFSEGSDPGEPPELETVPEPYESFPDPGFALPGDFLSAHTRSCADFPGQRHGAGDCWCSIAEETAADEYSWVLPGGELSERTRRVLHQPLLGDSSLRDSCGNTPLHLFAALEGTQDILGRMVTNCEGGRLAAVNSARQTFLHVLNLDWMFAQGWFTKPTFTAERFFTALIPSYGTHRSSPALSLCLIPCSPHAADAFGFNPVPDTDPANQSPYIPPRRTGSLSPQVEDLARASPNSQPNSSASEGSFLAYHARLVQVIQSSYNNPTVEDADGRNGLHCLAQAILNQQAMDRHVRSSSSSSAGGRPHLKRKLDASKDTPTPSHTSPTPVGTPTAGNATTTTTSSTEGTLPTRLRHLHSLLHRSVAVSVAHYDRRGYTPLMAFVEHVADDQDDKARTLQAILETLVRAGASIEARNRRGETPLLMAARLGRKVALATLLECGANVHARDVDGRGVLEVLDAEVGGERARKEVGLYARLEACRVLLTGRREWGVGRCYDSGSPEFVQGILAVGCHH